MIDRPDRPCREYKIRTTEVTAPLLNPPVTSWADIETCDKDRFDLLIC